MSQATAPTAPAAQARPNESNLIWVDPAIPGLEAHTAPNDQSYFAGR